MDRQKEAEHRTCLNRTNNPSSPAGKPVELKIDRIRTAQGHVVDPLGTPQRTLQFVLGAT